MKTISVAHWLHCTVTLLPLEGDIDFSFLPKPNSIKEHTVIKTILSLTKGSVFWLSTTHLIIPHISKLACFSFLKAEIFLRVNNRKPNSLIMIDRV